MKFRRIISIVLLLCLTFSLASCRSGGDSKKVVKDFMSAMGTYDVNKMAQYLEDVPSSDSAYLYDVYTDGHYVNLYKAAYKDTLTYEIVSAKGNTVKVKVTMPDLVTLYSGALTSVASEIFSDPELLDHAMDPSSELHLELLAEMTNAISNGDVDTITEEFTLKLGTINGELKIMLNDQLEQLMTSKLSLTQKSLSAESEE